MADSLNVLFIHRKGIFDVEGGEQDQIRNVRAALEDVGLRVTLADTLPANLGDYDLIHYFGLDACHIKEILGAKGVPKVMTPVFWDRAQGYLLDNEFEEWPRPGRALVDRIDYWYTRISGKRDRRVSRICRAHFYSALHRFGEFQRVIDEIDLFLPNSEAEADSLSTFYVMESCRYRVVPNAINIAAANSPSNYAERHLPNGSPFVMCSAGIDRRKNQYSLMKAMLDVDVPLVLAGGARDGRYLETVRRVAERRKGTFFLGHLDPPDLHSVYEAAAVHVLPSMHDTPGISNLEAVAHECANVGTQIGGLREYLGDYSLYCNPFSVEHIREQILRALSSPPNVEGARLVRDSYTYEHVAEATKRAYSDLLEES